MESKFKPFFQVIPVLSDTISSSFDYDPDPPSRNPTKTTTTIPSSRRDRPGSKTTHIPAARQNAGPLCFFDFYIVLHRKIWYTEQGKEMNIDFGMFIRKHPKKRSKNYETHTQATVMSATGPGDGLRTGRAGVCRESIGIM